MRVIKQTPSTHQFHESQQTMTEISVCFNSTNSTNCEITSAFTIRSLKQQKKRTPKKNFSNIASIPIIGNKSSIITVVSAHNNETLSSSPYFC